MDTNLLFTTVATIVLAFAGYLITYFNNLRLAQRAERLERVSRQLSELYGPMFALVHATDITWSAFRLKYRVNNDYYFDDDYPPNNEECEAWRLWVVNVFMPINMRLYETVLSKSDLLIESEMPESLLLLCAHVAAYQAVVKKWEQKDFSEHASLVNFPSKSLLDYADNSYYQLKMEQTKLLGKKPKTSEGNSHQLPSLHNNGKTDGLYSNELLKVTNNKVKEQLYPLTDREAKTLNLILKDRERSNMNIANELGVQQSTARNLIHSIYQKYGVHNRNELIDKIGKLKLHDS